MTGISIGEHRPRGINLAGIFETVYRSEDVEAALNDAERFASEGAYEKALERHVWYHENALKYAPDHVGVRLSFALMSWAELGGVYPPARDALRRARDKAVANYRRAPHDEIAFMEGMNLNMALDDLTSAKGLFYEGREGGVDGSELMLELDRIIAEGDLDWARDVVGNPDEKLGAIRESWEMMQFAMSSQVVTLLEGVAKTHGLERAKEIQGEALLILDTPAIREALE